MAPAPTGRPSKLTPEIQERICQLLRLGSTFRTACEVVGIGYATGKEWRARGEDRDPERPGDEDFATFAAATRQAEEEAIARCAKVVQKSVLDGSLQAATWFLERRRPDEWGRVDRHVLAKADAQPKQLGQGMSIEQLRARVVELATELGYVSPLCIESGDVIDVEAESVGDVGEG